MYLRVISNKILIIAQVQLRIFTHEEFLASFHLFCFPLVLFFNTKWGTLSKDSLNFEKRIRC